MISKYGNDILAIKKLNFFHILEQVTNLLVTSMGPWQTSV